MEAIITELGLDKRQGGITLATSSPPAAAGPESPIPTVGNSLSAGSLVGASAPVPITPLEGGNTVTTTPPASSVTVTSTPTAAAQSSATSSSTPATSGGIQTTTLVAILVPICVLLALIPTVAYLCYLRRRDRKNREMEAEILRGRLAPSGASAHTADALLMRRSMSASSQREPKYPSVSSEDLDLATMEKGPRQPEIRDSASIFAPPQHGLGRKGAPGTVDTSRKPGVPVPAVASQSPTLPPLHFEKESADRDAFAVGTAVSPPKPIPSTLPSFAPSQPRRAPNPALAPAALNARSATASPIPNPGMSPAIASSKASPHVSNMDNPNWPLPASSARDSASTYSSVSTVPAPAVNKPLPSGLSRELSPGRSVVPRNQAARTQQPGPRESSIAYGMPPMPPSPQEQGEAGDRRSGASRKRDSDAVSELSYSMSVRGKRDTRRDTDAISVISAMSDKDR